MITTFAICQAHHAFVDSVAMGARKGVTECRVQFQWDKWNCPVTDLPIFSSDEHADGKIFLWVCHHFLLK